MAVKVGAPAPDFALQDQFGQPVTLSDFAGKRNVVLVFYPFAFSRVCTSELREIRDHLGSLTRERAALLAVSCDHMFSLRAFREDERLEFPLLSDFWPHGAVSRVYGVFNEQLGCSDRATFVVDQLGVLRWEVKSQIAQPRSLEDYRRALQALD